MQITLATLRDATAQQVFDQVATHLLTQAQKSQDKDGSCVYRTTEDSELETVGGLSCAAGCLIADDEYQRTWEFSGWESLVNDCLVPSTHDRLIGALQDIHDAAYVNQWPTRLRALANGRGFKTDVIDNLLESFTAKIEAKA